MDINVVSITGRLTKDPEVKTVGSGKTVVQLGVAVSGFKKDETFFFDVLWWPAKPEHAGYFHKGNRVAISGSLKHERWTDNNGQNQSRVKVNAQTVVSLEKRPDDAGQPAQQQRQGGFGQPAQQQRQGGFGRPAQQEQPVPSAQYYTGGQQAPAPCPSHFNDEDIPF